MDPLFNAYKLGNLELANRFVLPPIKTAYAEPNGRVSKKQLIFYQQIAKNGPGLLIIEPVAVTADGREHPKQLSVHLPDSVSSLKKIVDVIHEEDRMVCLHLNHAGAAANPKATAQKPKAPSPVLCPTTGQEAEELSIEEIEAIIEGFRSAAEKAKEAGFDAIEIQGGHGYLISQFLNAKINHRSDTYGQNRLYFAERVFEAVSKGAGDLTCLLRISGNEMSPEFGIDPSDIVSLIKMAESFGISAIHVGMGSSCFSPPWYFHHSRMPEDPQWEALKRIREETDLPLIAAGRMGRVERVQKAIKENIADLIAIGRPLIADPDLIEKWKTKKSNEIKYCGYCLQGCLHRVKNGKPLGCNINPEIAELPMEKTNSPLSVLVAGGGPAGMSAALYLSKRGHKVTLVEQSDKLGGQFNLVWKAPGKAPMREGLSYLVKGVETYCEQVITGKIVDLEMIKKIKPDLLVWAAGAIPNIPEIEGIETQNSMSAIDYFSDKKEVKGPRVLVIGAGRIGLEIIEKLGAEGFEVVGTKRTDPIGGMIELITKKLMMMHIEQMPNVTLMPHTRVKSFKKDAVLVEQDGEEKSLSPFSTVILATGMVSAPLPDPEIEKVVDRIEIIGDANNVADIFSAIHAGYDLAKKYN